MLAQWLRERDKQKQKERLEKVREESAEAVKKWQVWYDRMQAANKDGLTFDEPPPGHKKDVEEK